jgi:hypothetical protein
METKTRPASYISFTSEASLALFLDALRDRNSLLSFSVEQTCEHGFLLTIYSMSH